MELEGIKWPADFSELQIMDTAFKCGICYDYMKTSMITQCSHTYCSLCIRKFLQYSAKCPTCFVETHENDLRNNRPLDNIIMLYLQVRNKLLRSLRVAEVASKGSVNSSPAPSSNPASQVVVSTLAVTPKSGIKSFVTKTPNDKTPVARNRLFPSLESPRSSISLEDIPESIECKVPLMFTSSASKASSSVALKAKTPVDKSQCPVCQVDIPSKNINMHLDACLARSNNPPKEIEAVAVVKKRDPLPKRLYHMMNDKTLKQELKSHGLSIHGDRKAWLSRIRRFTVVYNSETDVDNPRPVSQLIQQLEREEREEKKKDNPLFKSLSQKVDRYSNPDAIAKANKQYIEDNKDSFQKMIEQMKAREGRNIKPNKPINLLESDEESDGLKLVGGCAETASTSFDPSAPSTSHFESNSQKDDQKDKSLLLESPPHQLSDSSMDSVFDFTPNRTVIKSKNLIRRSAVRKSRSESPEIFNENSSTVSVGCIPDADLYTSIFGNDDDEETNENGDNECTPIENSELEHGPTESNDCLEKSPLCTPLEDDIEESPATKLRNKRKPSKAPQDEDATGVRRSSRNAKKIKSM